MTDLRYVEGQRDVFQNVFPHSLQFRAAKLLPPKEALRLRTFEISVF